jgi:hypothetical protein
MPILTKLQTPSELAFGRSLRPGSQIMLPNCIERTTVVDQVTVRYNAFHYLEDPKIVRIDVIWRIL